MRLLFLSFLCGASIVVAQPNYDAYDTLLGKYVGTSGQVNYKGLKTDAAELDRITQTFSAQTPSATWSKNERLAFWMTVTRRLLSFEAPALNLQYSVSKSMPAIS